MRHDPENPVPGASRDEIVLDGVRYADLAQAGQEWRLGAVNPLWRQELLALPANPDADALTRLEGRGLWLAPAHQPAPPLAVMCCGLGAVWPGMGRELYDSFPVARAAMDRIAAVADWDVLALMDETDVEKISLTRWQSPYVFMLEYAQWSVLASLGLSPSLFCGHSLGEIIALCFSGIYAPEVAWYILDTRAVHMGELEARATRETGMMAVHADAEVIREACAAWPGLYVSNYNTPRQFILSGPREVLQEARKSLRKRRIPAIVLNVSVAFHHPSMRVLRDLSLRRLNALEMHAPQHPMLSCITTDFYPDDQPSISRRIADLDENSVRWTECVQSMWNRHGIRYFLELGPQDTLCSLVADNEPRARCLAAGRKGREVESLRQACAQLYSLGYLRRESLAQRVSAAADGGDARLYACEPAPHSGLRPVAGVKDAAAPDHAPAQEPAAAQPAAREGEGDVLRQADAATPAEGRATAPYAKSLEVVLGVLAKACGRPVADLRPEMDLRYDLALRSSRFPLIVQEVEKALGLSVNFEDMLRVSTISDLARVLSGGTVAHETGGAALERAAAGDRAIANPLRRYAPLAALPAQAAGEASPALAPLLLNPCASGAPLRSGDVLALCVLDVALLPRLLSGIAPLGCVLGVPEALLERCAPLAKAGSRLAPFKCGLPENADAAALADCLREAVADLAATEGRVDGLLFVPPVPTGALGCKAAAAASALTPEASAAVLRAALEAALPHGLRFVYSCAVLPPEPVQCVFDGPLEAVVDMAREKGLDARSIRMLHGEERASLDEWGDMLARELLCGTEARVVWARPQSFAGPVVVAEPAPTKSLRECPGQFPLAFPDPRPPYRPDATLFQGACHFSRYADPSLSSHGGQQGNLLGETDPVVPGSRGLEALFEGARLCLPWLQVTGFCDLRFFDAPSLPLGVTRECRLTVEAEPWLLQDGVMTRMCRSVLAARGLTSNGRHTADYAPVSEGMVWLASRRNEVLPLWPDAGKAAAPRQTDEIGVFYTAAGLGSEWRLVESFAALHDEMFAATLRLPEASIAPEGECGYSKDLLVVEGVMQAAWLAITCESSKTFSDAAAIAAQLRMWRLNAAGFIRIGEAGAEGPLRLLMRRSWADGRLLRFDAQVADHLGRVFLTMHHLEFDRRTLELTGASSI